MGHGTRASREGPIGMLGRWLAVGLVGLLLAGCVGRAPLAPLPPAAELVPDRLVILLHGYTSDAEATLPLRELLYREGVPRGWVKPGLPGRMYYHTHAFDFGTFTRVGSDHNVAVEDLAEALSGFYHKLPESCPVCRERAERPVQVTLVARSLGGIIGREFLLREEERGELLQVEVPGEGSARSPWRIRRVVTLGTPFYGSFKTLLSRGFLSLVINGMIRTVLLGFVKPEAGGTFGNVVDAQARALRYGSPFLFQQHMRWRALLERAAAAGRATPPWLVVASVGSPNPARNGDGVTRFASANVLPNLPNAPMEMFLTDVRHGDIFRAEGGDDPRRQYREMIRTARAVVRFIEAGTLRDDPTGATTRWQIVGARGARRLEPLRRDTSEEGSVVYLQSPDDQGRQDALYHKDLRRKVGRVNEALAADLGDLWLRFYDGLPDGPTPPEVLPLRRALSLFRSGVERSRSWVDLVAATEADSAGAEVPVVQEMAPLRPHLITLPDITPTGLWGLVVRVDVPRRARPVAVAREDIRVVYEGEPVHPPIRPGDESLTALWIDPHRTNLVSIYLDGSRLRARYPELGPLEIRELGLDPIGP